mmetsp:Transcript_27556/g.41671  ORF Transcript_27556/g.41671 Transcript_27556/m.41671 type:complete len:222 (+) Transcript_27556:105-770(+)
MAAPLKLIGNPAMRAFRNVWMLEELGLKYENVPAMPLSKEAKQYHPHGKLPILVDAERDFFLFESAAINTYLADKFRGQGELELVPVAGTTERGRYEQMVSYIITEVDTQGLWIHRKHDHFKKIFGSIPEAVKVAKATCLRSMTALLDDMDKLGYDYLLGSKFSAADILFMDCLLWAQDIKWIPFKDAKVQAAAARYMKAIEARPAYQKALAQKKGQMSKL